MNIFIYGTLKNQFESVPGKIHGWTLYQLYKGSEKLYPTIQKGKENDFVTGELLTNLNEYDIMALDRIEGYPYLYRRENVQVECENGMVEAQAYVFNHEDYAYITLLPIGATY